MLWSCKRIRLTTSEYSISRSRLVPFTEMVVLCSEIHTYVLHSNDPFSLGAQTYLRNCSLFNAPIILDSDSISL